MDIQLKPFTDEDMPLFCRWLGSERIQRWYAPVEDWIAEVSQREGEYHWIRHYIIVAGAEPIGFCQCYPYWKGGEDWHGSIPLQETYSVDYLIGEERYLRHGCAAAALRRLGDMIFSRSDARRIIAQPDEDNNASRRTLLSAGYAYDAENQLYIMERGGR